MLLHLVPDEGRFCDQSMSLYITNLTSSYTNKSNEPTVVSSSVIMFVLAGLFFNLNLFSGISDVSAILDPKVRFFLTSALSLFLPVMSYLFSEAKNARNTTSSSSSTAGAAMADLSLTAGLILTWMLLVELLRKKVDEIRMRGYSSTIQRAGRVAWLGSLVFFNIKSAGRKAVFSILWILCATKVGQRIAFTEVGKRSYAHGKNASVLTSYMAQMLEQHKRRQERHPGEHGVEHAAQDGDELLKSCRYIVMGEKKLVRKATADGYEFNETIPSNGIITVGNVWELPETGRAHTDLEIGRLKRICLSFALFKLLRRRFEHQAAMTDEEARDCRKLILNGLYKKGDNKATEALFQVMNDEVNFLSEYYHSVIPVVFASPFFLLANYLLLPIVVAVLCLMSIVLCSNGDVLYAFKSLGRDNYTLRSGVPKIVLCLVAKAAHGSAPAFFSLVDLTITVFLFIIFFYEEIWEFVVFLLSNWFMVSVICSYRAKAHWPESPTFSGVFRRLLWLRSKMGQSELRVKQFSVLNLRWPLNLPLFAPLSMAIRSERVPNRMKQSIMDCLVEHCPVEEEDCPVPVEVEHCPAVVGHSPVGVEHCRGATTLANGKSALAKNHLSNELSWACMSDSVAEVMLTWHIATSILEVKCPSPTPSNAEEVASRRVAVKLSKYCAYLVAFHPELLPDNKEKAECVFDDMKAELKGMLRCPAYFFSSKGARVEKMLKTIGVGNDKETPRQTEIQVETPGHSDQSKVVLNGTKLGKFLVGHGTAAWKVLADVWTELIVYAAPSNDEERVKGHEEVLVQGGEFITVLWALTTHLGVTRPPPPGKQSTTVTGNHRPPPGKQPSTTPGDHHLPQA